MENYKPNSHKFKEEQRESNTPKKEVKKVVKGVVKTKKKNEVQKFAESFISDDITDMKTFVISEVVVPAIKKTLYDTVSGIFDIIKDSVETALYGEAVSRKRKGSTIKTSFTPYYEFSNKERKPSSERKSSSRFDYDDIVVSSRGEAEAIFNQMNEMIIQYGVVSVADLYDMIGELAPFTANRYGWENIRNADVKRVRDGYLLVLPKALPID